MTRMDSMSVRLGILNLLGAGRMLFCFIIRCGLTKRPTVKTILGDVDVQVCLIAVHQTREGGEQVMSIGWTRVCFRMVLN